MEQLTTRIGIEPGPGLVGRFGDTVIVIPRGEAAGPASAGATQELLGLAVRTDLGGQAEQLLGGPGAARPGRRGRFGPPGRAAPGWPRPRRGRRPRREGSR